LHVEGQLRGHRGHECSARPKNRINIAYGRFFTRSVADIVLKSVEAHYVRSLPKLMDEVLAPWLLW
jgi:hypothetical protein